MDTALPIFQLKVDITFPHPKWNTDETSNLLLAISTPNSSPHFWVLFLSLWMLTWVTARGRIFYISICYVFQGSLLRTWFLPLSVGLKLGVFNGRKHGQDIVWCWDNGLFIFNLFFYHLDWLCWIKITLAIQLCWSKRHRILLATSKILCLGLYIYSYIILLIFHY